MRSRNLVLAVLVALALTAVLAGCGGSSGSSSSPKPNAKEHSPSGDIPDTQAYVAYNPPGGGYVVKVPEGWARTTRGGAVSFTDKLNTITVESTPASAALTTTTARKALPQLTRSTPGFKLLGIDTLNRPAGPAVHITYLTAAKPDPVTGKRTVDKVERYVFFHKGRLVTLTLSGPKTADNVDPWKLVSSSVRWSP
jgi:hypothetical protein